MAASALTSLDAKIVILGAQGVGKTCLVHHFVNNTALTNPASTVGANFLTKRVVDEQTGIAVHLQLWDTAGQERFRAISKLYYRGANAAILCYDITDGASFEEIAGWLTELRENLDEDTILHIVGTKADIVAQDRTRRVVPYEDCLGFVADNLHAIHGTPLLGPANGGATPGRATTPDAEKMLKGGKADKAASQYASKNVRPNTPRMKSTTSLLATTDSPFSPHKRRSGPPSSNLSWIWSSCHEVSTTTGDNVDNVFRVVAHRLVEQQLRRMQLERMGNGAGGTEDGYFRTRHDRTHPDAGSFRVGHGDKRRSWMGLPTFGSTNEEEGQGSWEEQSQWQNEIERQRGRLGGRCC